MESPLRFVYRFAVGMQYARSMSISIQRATHVVFATASVPPAPPRASAPTDAVASTAPHLTAGLTERRTAPVQGMADVCTGFSAACGRLGS